MPNDATSFVDQLQLCTFESDADGNNGCFCLKPGTVVMILRGPFAGRHGIVQLGSAERCRLLLEVLGRSDVIVTVNTEDIEAVPSSVVDA